MENNQIFEVLSHMNVFAKGHELVKGAYIKGLPDIEFSEIGNFKEKNLNASFKNGVREKNKIISEKGKSMSVEDRIISIGTNKIVSIKEFNEKGLSIYSKAIELKTLFPQKEIIILTHGEALRGFVPIFDNLNELDIFLKIVQEYISNVPEDKRYWWDKEFPYIQQLGEFFL